jgi:archaellum component FlaF (FlaF/FlaG flagellin family)
MKRFVLLAVLFLLLEKADGQSISGQWKGGFNSGGRPDANGQTQYVLELEVKGTQVSGYSYTYFAGYEKRYYVICRLTGSYDKKSKSLEVTEVEKVKANTPPDFLDCLQIHSLTYMKGTDSREVLVGKWKPARPQDNCGTGATELERKALVKVVPKTTPPSTASRSNPKNSTGTAKTTTPVPKTSSTAKTTTPAPKTSSTAKTTTPAPKTSTTAKSATPKTTTPKTTTPPVAEVTKKPETIEKNLPSIEKPKAPSTIQQTTTKLNMRSKQVIKTVEVEASSFRVDLYDNGQIDGDTISVFYNGKLMVSRQRLSTEPISIQITLDPDKEDNELVMFAENLGTIPPNTALMIVTVAGKRYEVNISSSEQTSGTVRFRLASATIR